MLDNIILNTDSYKASHFQQYPPGTQYLSCYIESRGGKFASTLFFGFQMYARDYLSRPITRENIEEAAEYFNAHGLPFNRSDWEYILQELDGYLPVEVEAIAEGTRLPTHNVMLQIRNTDARCAWLTSYLETSLLRAIWYPTTVATLSWECKQIIAQYLRETADSLDGLPFKLHDFGARGASSTETSAIGGLAHLVNFKGTDTVASLVAARRYYHENMAGFSIPAAEHSTITCWGRDHEVDAFRNMLRQFSGKNRILAVVSDSYDLWNAIDKLWGDELADEVRQSGGTLVVRPDSGEPVSVVRETIEKLMLKFGHRINGKGYRLLPDYIRVIQGDGISAETIKNILYNLKAHHISADNIAFGMGAELLQKVNRDTQRFAMKASAVCIDNEWRAVYKDPITDQGKQSKQGRLALVFDPETGYRTVRQSQLGNQKNLLRPVFRNGQLLIDEDFETIRQRVEQEDDG